MEDSFNVIGTNRCHRSVSILIDINESLFDSGMFNMAMMMTMMITRHEQDRGTPRNVIEIKSLLPLLFIFER